MATIDSQIKRTHELCEHIKLIRSQKNEKLISYVGDLSILLHEKDMIEKSLSTASSSYPGVAEALKKLNEV